MKILPDTNILRKIATDDSIYTKFKNKILENDDQCYISPINLNELLYHIRADEDQDEFIQCAKALYRSGELAENRILPNPDDILLILHKHNSFDYIDSKYMEFYLLTRLFENVNHFDDIPSQKEIHVKQNGRRYKITFQNAALIKKYIDQIEKSYIDDIYNKIILPFDPKFLERDNGYGILQILSSKKLREVIRYIKSSNFDKDLTKVIFNL